MVSKTARRVLALLLLAGGPAAAEIYVGTYSGSLLVFPDGANGAQAPVRTITGLQTTLRFDWQVAIDALHGEVFALGGNGIVVFPLDATGNATPTRTISISIPGQTIWGLALDAVRDQLVVATSDNDSTSRILVYSRLASGAAAPLRTIAGSATKMTRVRNIAVDAVTGEIFVTSQNSPTQALLVFGPNANGNVAPIRTIQGPKTGLLYPNGVYIDRLHSEVLVADQAAGVLAYPQLGNGDISPLRHIVGALTLIPAAWAVSLLGDDEIAVVDSPEIATGSVSIFPRTANGNVAPRRHIAGDSSLDGSPAGLAVAEPTLFLHDRRFAVEATWTTPNGEVGSGHPVTLGDGDTGYFWFFSPANVETVVKALDGCAVNQRFWLFAGGLTNVRVALRVTDLATGNVRGYVNPLNKPFQPIQDVSAFATCPAAASASGRHEIDASAVAAELAAATEAAASAIDSTLAGCPGICLNNSRFQVEATWTLPDGSHGEAHGVKLTADTAYQWFFAPSNVETVIKVIDGCALNQHYWVFSGGLTNVAVELRVLDTQNGARVNYFNPKGTAFRPIQDVNAFACN